MEVPDRSRSGRVPVSESDNILRTDGRTVTPPEMRVNIGDLVGESRNGIYYRSEDTDAGSTAGHLPVRRSAAVTNTTAPIWTVFTTGSEGFRVSDRCVRTISTSKTLETRDTPDPRI